MRQKWLAVFLSILIILTMGIALNCGHNRSPAIPSVDPPTHPENPALIVDSDGDGYSDEFEIKVAKTDPLIPNERYALLINALLAEPFNFAEKEMYKFLTEKEKVPSENIVRLLGLEATVQNLEETLNQFAERIDENDIFLLSISTHGVAEGLVFYRQGSTEEWKTAPPEREKSITFGYWLLDQYLDKIKARAMVIMITACATEEGTLYNNLGDNSRVIVGTDHGDLLVDFLDALGTEFDLGVSWRYVFGEPAPAGSFTIGTEENPGVVGFGWRQLQPRDKLVKETYSSLDEIFQAIDKSGNGYVSIGEALEWTNWLRWKTYKEIPIEAEIKNPLRIDNLSLASELYFGDYRPRELK